MLGLASPMLTTPAIGDHSNEPALWWAASMQ